jgi:hypothetical protein
MTEAPASPFLKRGNAGSAQPVEIAAHDPYCTSLLFAYAASLFPAEIVSGSGWAVRLQPPTGGGGWVLDLLSLVERWLESARLPCAKVLYGGRSYLIRASTDNAHFRAAAESPRAFSAETPPR